MKTHNAFQKVAKYNVKFGSPMSIYARSINLWNTILLRKKIIPTRPLHPSRIQNMLLSADMDKVVGWKKSKNITARKKEREATK